MPVPVFVYAAAYVGGTLAGTALGTTIAKKVMPRPTRSSTWTQTSIFDMNKELQRLGFLPE